MTGERYRLCPLRPATRRGVRDPRRSQGITEESVGVKPLYGYDFLRLSNHCWISACRQRTARTPILTGLGKPRCLAYTYSKDRLNPNCSTLLSEANSSLKSEIKLDSFHQLTTLESLRYSVPSVVYPSLSLCDLYNLSSMDLPRRRELSIGSARIHVRKIHNAKMPTQHMQINAKGRSENHHRILSTPNAFPPGQSNPASLHTLYSLNSPCANQ